jgi:hypothetical protein
MKRRLQFIVFVLLLATLVTRSVAQSTAVTFQVVDTDGQTWNNGSWTVQLTSPPGVPSNNYLISGTSTVVPNQSQSGTLDASGNGSLSVTPNCSIAPAGTQWTFVFSPQATPTGSFQISYTICGASQVLTPIPPGVRVSVQSFTVRATAYTDAEITGGSNGSTYFNLIDQSIHVCRSVSANICTWAQVGSSNNTGAGAPTTSVQFNCAGSFCGDSNFEYVTGTRTLNLGTLNINLGGPMQFVIPGSTPSPPATNSSLTVGADGNPYWSKAGAAYVQLNAGGTVTGATANGGLLLSGTTLGMLTSCSNNQVLQWNTTAWVCSTIAGSGTIIGSGSSPRIAEWTGASAIGNSPIFDNGVTGIAASISLTDSTCASGGTCHSLLIQSPNVWAASSFQQHVAIRAESTSAGTTSSTSGPQTAGFFGALWSPGASSLTLGELDGIVGDTTICPGGCSVQTDTVTFQAGGVFLGIGQDSSVTTNVGAYVDTNVLGSSTVTTDVGVYIDTPGTTTKTAWQNTTGGGTFTHHYGLFIADQVAAGASTNSDPHSIHQLGNAPNEFQGHINQIASGNWAGSCAMSAGTTCTFSITTAYTGTPLSFVSLDAASTPPATAISVKCAVSGTTVTITAGASNSLTWDCLLVGNPN